MDFKSLKQLVKGILSYSPLDPTALGSFRANRMKANAFYCYEVWLKHLIMGVGRGGTAFPENVMEIGPGDSLGFGMAALISGVSRYVAVDAVRFTAAGIDREMFFELVSLFKNRTPIPHGGGIPDIGRFLGDSGFPESLLTDDHLRWALDDGRLAELENLEVRTDTGIEGAPVLSYLAPYSTFESFECDSFDLIFSHAVLEHIDDVSGLLAKIESVMKPAGCSTHQVDLGSHGTAREWNGHWKYGPTLWRWIRGRRPYLINRLPASGYRRIVEDSNLTLVHEETYRDATGIRRENVSPQWSHLTDEDLTTAGTYLVLKK